MFIKFFILLFLYFFFEVNNYSKVNDYNISMLLNVFFFILEK